MKIILILSSLLLAGGVFADGYCQQQPLLGFKDAVFVMGADMPNSNPQRVVNELLFAAVALTQVDTFATSTPYYALLRIRDANGLALMTADREHVYLYLVLTEKMMGKDTNSIIKPFQFAIASYKIWREADLRTVAA